MQKARFYTKIVGGEDLTKYKLLIVKLFVGTQDIQLDLKMVKLLKILWKMN